jgi:quercetin dioxygenase-like cupin family protein
MLSPLLLLTALLSFTSAQYSNPNNGHTTNPGLVASLKTAATRYDRDQLLKEDTDWWYDAYKHPNFNNANGGVVTVDVSKLPALEGAGVSIAMIRMGPCSMLPIHEHPWANNLVYGIKGNVTSWMVGDDGDRVHTVNIYENIATLFPQGSIHGMQNEGVSLCASVLSYININ